VDGGEGSELLFDIGESNRASKICRHDTAFS
jgi:hypothetical protein